MAAGGGYYHPACPDYEQQHQNCGYQQPAPPPPPPAGYETMDHSGGLPHSGRTVEWYQWNYLEEMRQKDIEKMTFVLKNEKKKLKNEKKKRQQMEKSLWNAEKRCSYFYRL